MEQSSLTKIRREHTLLRINGQSWLCLVNYDKDKYIKDGCSLLRCRSITSQHYLQWCRELWRYIHVPPQWMSWAPMMKRVVIEFCLNISMPVVPAEISPLLHVHEPKQWWIVMEYKLMLMVALGLAMRPSFVIETWVWLSPHFLIENFKTIHGLSVARPRDWSLLLLLLLLH